MPAIRKSRRIAIALALLPIGVGALAAGWAAPVFASLPEAASLGPSCRAAESTTCVPLVLHLTSSEGVPACDLAWLRRQVAEANRHFADSQIAFEVTGVQALPASAGDVANSADRDALGASRASDGLIDVFVVTRLADIDRDGLIRGVHWRHRTTKQRWIVLADDAPDMVLAHELGHWFSLPHARYPESIMNKSDDPSRPPPSERSFVAAERKTIARSLRKQLRSGQVVALRSRRPE